MFEIRKSHLVVDLGGNSFVATSHLLPLERTDPQSHLPQKKIIWQDLEKYLGLQQRFIMTKLQPGIENISLDSNAETQSKVLLRQS